VQNGVEFSRMFMLFSDSLAIFGLTALLRLIGARTYAFPGQAIL
jgi:hypothetical protein